jgi:hypothetical protein
MEPLWYIVLPSLQSFNRFLCFWSLLFVIVCVGVVNPNLNIDVDVDADE